MSYQLNRVHLLICIFAGLVLAAGFVWRLFSPWPSNLFTFAMWVSAAIIVFYIIGTFVRAFLISKVFVPTEEYDFSQDEEYQAFMASLNNEAPPAEDVMLDAPIDEIEYDETLNDPFMEPLEDIS